MSALFAVIEGMAVEKLNVLHWHAVDDQSFPLESTALPRLAVSGPYAPQLRYTVENISTVVQFARSRGVRVILEIDTPGHSKVLGHAYPEVGLVTRCPGTTCWPPLDPANNATLQFVRELWHDFGALFPDANVFIGGDECHTACWAANAGVASWAAASNLSLDGGGEGTVFGWWIDRVVDIVHGEMGKKPMMWSPLEWDPNAPPKALVDASAILNLWTGSIGELAFNITLKGTNELVLSNGWYLPTGRVYDQEPRDACPKGCSDAQRARIIGGEACQWGEGVDATNLFTSLWPDVTQVAERLWTSNASADDGGQPTLDLLDGNQLRLRRQRCRLVSRGVPAPAQAAVYVPDASHASFALCRELQWCSGDANGAVPSVEPSEAVREWAAAAAKEHRRRARDKPLAFDTGVGA